MKTKNFTISQNIYVVVHNHELDLHNNYDFCGFAFDGTQRSLRLSWQKTKGDWVQANDSPSLELRVIGVRSFQVTPRDPKLPFSEDSCLTDISFLCDEPWCNEPFTTDKTPDESWKWVFQFMSGSSIVVDAEEIEAIT
ncbi:MAG: hypothetical protein A2283_01700 [Lentisphaerae bacterium RIFOXYA12_FULL_48_11]|nr:MAG: hypothetical protein A2283_01700 [Lentisphaerae bacterium RIFOXYA12_FULL_48_11]